MQYWRVFLLRWLFLLLVFLPGHASTVGYPPFSSVLFDVA
jgi:hypothetical protein